MEQHSFLSPSGSSRWLNCTPSAKLEHDFGEKTITEYAQEGTLAHEIAALTIAIEHGLISDEVYSTNIEKCYSSELFNNEMLNHLAVYEDYVNSNMTDSSFVYVEQRVDISNYIPECFGTVDCFIITENKLEVIDLKYGKGVPVYAEGNTQLRIYALGILDFLDFTNTDISEITITIVQPRLNNISSESFSKEELLDWADNYLIPRAQLAFAGEGELQDGNWCKFCSVKHLCQKLYEETINMAKRDFSKGFIISDNEVVDILSKSKLIKDYIDAVEEYAIKQSKDLAKKWPGFKLVEGQSRRKWAKDDESVIAEIHEKLPEYDPCEQKLKSFTTVEKELGKELFSTIKDLVIKPSGKPILVPDSDKREELSTSALTDFNKE